ncbi:MAG: hypothetical protein ACKOZV_15785 [Bacteroidota bacterium]
MTPADFQGEFGSNASISQGSRPALHLVSDQTQTTSTDKGEAKQGGAQRPKSGFLNQSIDEIARLYVESPFSW